ncbi:MAG: DUF2399 domain-containing protein [Chitinophagales bacterium]|nr:DUF2399 domain-containing protein [Chitinophagales bacterium]
MISPAEIRKKALKHYGHWLERIARGEADFIPLEIKRTGDQKGADGRWEMLQELNDQRKDKIGYGYWIELEPPAANSRHKQSRVRSIHFDTADDLLRYIDKATEFEHFKADCALIAALPVLDAWRAANTGAICKYAQRWPQLLAVVRFFQENPNPALPVRLLPIEGVDSKFIEHHNSILCQLLDNVLPIKKPDQKSFTKRFGLPDIAPMIEIAWNDPVLTQYFRGFTRLALPSDELASSPLPVSRVLVVENRNSITQVLQAPLPDTVVVLGGGYAVSLLRHAKWLKQLRLQYWGDIDTHGLAILGQFRNYFPNVEALLMDETTLLAHRSAWVSAPAFRGTVPSGLTQAEAALFQRLAQECIRLEQERIADEYLKHTGSKTS